ncbi:MAG: type II toxin-antitoxin system RelE/ParE family toxin [Pseudomonadota bacterium]
MAAFKLTSAAKGDLKRIAVFTERRWGKEQRNQYLRQLDAAFRELTENPGLGTRCDYIRPAYRKFPISSHVIYYRYSENDRVEIIRILHKHMDVSRALAKA